MVRRTHISIISTLLSVTALIFVLSSNASISYAEQDDTMIDGYELPDMFEDNISTALPTQNAPDQLIKQPSINKQLTRPTKAQPIQQAPFEPTFKPLSPAKTQIKSAAKNTLATPVLSVLPAKRPVLIADKPQPKPQLQATQPPLQKGAPQKTVKIVTATDNTVALPQTIPAAPMPATGPATGPTIETIIEAVVEPIATPTPIDTTPIAKQAAEPITAPLAESIAEPLITAIEKPIPVTLKKPAPTAEPKKLAYGGTLSLPVKRPIIYKKYKKAAQKTSLSKTGSLIMPAVPAGKVSAVPLAQPEITMITAITSDLPPEIEGIESINDISVPTELEVSAAEQDDVFDVSQSMQSDDGDDSYPQTAAPANINQAPSHANASLFFTSGQDQLSDEMKKSIEQNVIPKLLQDTTLRIEIKSYAEAPDESPSSARRLSLSRALDLRTYLLSRKIDSYRMDVRALGNATDTIPMDRIDVGFIH
tara:strand:+ start:421953 stop:423386 length:1434 start_codon:yes stop_codon:yes gene_type:complete